MANPEQLEEQREETRLIIEELLEDGSDPDALYTIEHHLSADDLETLEKAAVEAFKLGYEVTDPEELEVEDGDIVICCDILSECALNADLIDAQVEQLMTLAEKFDVEYDANADIRFSHENPDVQACYREFLGAPLSPLAEELLHTDHHAWSMPNEGAC